MRLIDADVLIAEYDRVHIGKPGGARKLMVDAPTIEERKVGKWIEKDEFTVECSICKSEWLYETHYCPHCGARMEVGT